MQPNTLNQENKILKKKIGQKIRSKRLQLNLNQTELGKIVGYNQDMISRVERGRTHEYQQRVIMKALNTRLKNSVQTLPIYHISSKPKIEETHTSSKEEIQNLHGGNNQRIEIYLLFGISLGFMIAIVLFILR